MHVLRNFLAQYPTKRFDKDQMIIFQDEKPSVMYMIKLGFVKGYDITPDGVERIVSFVSRGDLFPLGWLFSKQEVSQHYFCAASTCEVYLIPKEEFLQFLKSNNEAMFELTTRIVESYYQMLDRVVSIEQSKASDKILHTLKFLGDNYGRSAGSPTTHVEVPMKVQDIGSMVGLTRETVGAEMKKLKKAGVLTHKKWQFSINHLKLEELLTKPLKIARQKTAVKIAPKTPKASTPKIAPAVAAKSKAAVKPRPTGTRKRSKR